MKFHRIYGIILRYMFYFRRSLDRLSDSFYWPTIDLVVWGITSTYFKTYAPESSQIVLIVVSGILLALIVWRAQYEITLNLLEDMWNKNLINIFVAPLKFSEWITSFLILGIFKAILSLSFAMVVAYILYKVEIFFYGFYLIPFILLLILTGWWVGFFVAGIILRFGTKVQTLGWSMVAILFPFSAIYYPVSILPEWAQKISLFVPASYVFEGSRQIINTGNLDINKLLISFGISIVYIILSLIFLKKSFQKVLERGLARLD